MTFLRMEGDLTRGEQTVCSTEGFSGADRLGYWQDSLMKVCGDFSTEARDRGTFSGSIGLASIGGIEIARISSNADRITRSKSQIDGSDSRYCFLITQVAGTSSMEQGGERAELKPGDMTLIDSSRPSCFDFSGRFSQLSLHLPRKTVENGLRSRRIPVANRIPGGSGVGALASDFIAGLYSRAAELDVSQSGAVRDALLGIIGSVLSGEQPHSARFGHLPPNKVSQVRDLQHFIECRLPDPALTPAHIAAEYRISTRHLHRIFQWAGVSFGEWVKTRRLEKCRDDLANPRYAGHGIIQIAFHWGFNDASHFSRAFKSQYGLSPREFRIEEAKRRAARL